MKIAIPTLRRPLGSIDFGARGRCSLLPERRQQAGMMPTLAVNKALSLVAILAIAVLAGCSSPSPESSPTTGTHLSGPEGS